MMEHIALGVVAAIAVALALIVYWKVITAYMTAHADAVGKDAQLKAASGWSWLMVKIAGWKTIILGWIAAIFGLIGAVPADIVNTWTGLPWANFVDQKVAAGISIFCATIIPIVHAQGVKQAAQTQPVEGQ